MDHFVKASAEFFIAFSIEISEDFSGDTSLKFSVSSYKDPQIISDKRYDLLIDLFYLQFHPLHQSLSESNGGGSDKKKKGMNVLSIECQWAGN